MKNAIATIVSAVTGFSMTKKTSHDDMQVLFYKEALRHGHHGTILASSVLHRLDNTLVRFVFPGLTEAPQMNPELLAYIWKRAAAAGFEAHCLKDYGTKVSDRTTTPAGAVSGQLRKAEDDKMAPRNIPVAAMPPVKTDRVARSASTAFEKLQEQAQANSDKRKQSAEAA